MWVPLNELSQTLVANWHALAPGAILLAGLVASPHCAVMCGPLNVHFARKTRHLLIYQLARLASYSAAGALAGVIGNRIFDFKSSIWIGALGTLLVTLVFLCSAVRLVRGKPWGIHFQPRLPQPLLDAKIKLWQLLRSPRLSPAATAGLAGALTILLPCGHLYTFLAAAALTGQALGGAVFMSLFAVGTWPLLILGSVGVRKNLFTGPWLSGVKKTRAAGVLLFFACLLSLASFASHLYLTTLEPGSNSSNTSTPHGPLCH